MTESRKLLTVAGHYETVELSGTQEQFGVAVGAVCESKLGRLIVVGMARGRLWFANQAKNLKIFCWGNVSDARSLKLKVLLTSDQYSVNDLLTIFDALEDDDDEDDLSSLDYGKKESLVTVEDLKKYPSLFRRIICATASSWVGDRSVYNNLSSLEKKMADDYYCFFKEIRDSQEWKGRDEQAAFLRSITKLSLTN